MIIINLKKKIIKKLLIKLNKFFIDKFLNFMDAINFTMR